LAACQRDAHWQDGPRINAGLWFGQERKGGARASPGLQLEADFGGDVAAMCTRMAEAARAIGATEMPSGEVEGWKHSRQWPCVESVTCCSASGSSSIWMAMCCRPSVLHSCAHTVRDASVAPRPIARDGASVENRKASNTSQLTGCRSVERAMGLIRRLAATWVQVQES